jgi:hypothetical protein
VSGKGWPEVEAGWPVMGAAEGAALSSQRKKMTPVLVFIFYFLLG